MLMRESDWRAVGIDLPEARKKGHAKRIFSRPEGESKRIARQSWPPPWRNKQINHDFPLGKRREVEWTVRRRGRREEGPALERVEEEERIDDDTLIGQPSLLLRPPRF